ncbi:MAG: Ig-like domain-containing protein, partial [Acidimicrobiales bacterium]
LTFSGIQFSYATWNDPSNPAGFADVQSNLRMSLPGGNQGECTFSSPAGTCPWGALTQPLPNVGFSASNDITLANDRFVDLGGVALGFEYGDSGDTVSGSLFDHIASTAVLLGCTYDPNPTDPADAKAIIAHCSLDPSAAAGDSIGTDEILTGTTVEDNVIENVGTDYPSACGITLLFSQHTTITHNDIFDVPYTAITAGVIQGHVDDQTHSQNSTNVNGFNRISDNLIHDYMQTLNDGGAMYIEGHQAQYVDNPDGTVNQTATLANGMQAVGNVAYDKVGFSPVMYDDAGSEYINWQDNVAFKVNGNSAQGGCDPTGPFGLEGNMASGGFESYFCLPSGVSITTFASQNTSIPDAPGPNDLPASAIDGAGVDGADAARLISRPQAFYVSPESSASAAIPNAVLIGGEGFTSSTPVTFSGQPATSVKALSPGFLIATVPAGANPAQAVVGTPVQAPKITSPDPGSVDVSASDLQVSGTAAGATTVAVEIDGAQFSGCDARPSGGTWSCTVGSLSPGEHTLTATATDASGGSATSSPTLIDVGGSPPASMRINDTDSSIVYSADWNYSSNRGLGDYQDDVHYTTTNGGTASWTFIGTGVKVYGELYTDQGNVGISVDGGPQQVVSTLPPGTQRESNQVIWQDLSLTPGQHTVTVTKLSGTYTTIDGFEADDTSGS